MPPRKSATAEITEPGPAEESEQLDKATVVGWVKEAVAEILHGKDPDAEPVQGANELEESEGPAEILGPREQERHGEQIIREALGGIHIHMGKDDKPEPEPKKEPEETPGKPPFLKRFVGLAP